jgi:hypothetical protein
MSDELQPRQLELFKNWLEVQRQEVDLRRDELEVRKAELRVEEEGQRAGFDYARASLEAQTTDRESERKHRSQTIGRGLLFSGFCTLLVGLLLAYALYANKDEFVQQFFQTVVTLLGGGAVGYYLRGRQDKRDAATGPDDGEQRRV